MFAKNGAFFCQICSTEINENAIFLDCFHFICKMCAETYKKLENKKPPSPSYTICCKICSKTTVFSKEPNYKNQNDDVKPVADVKNEMKKSTSSLSDTIKRLKSQIATQKKSINNNEINDNFSKTERKSPTKSSIIDFSNFSNHSSPKKESLSYSASNDYDHNFAIPSIEEILQVTPEELPQVYLKTDNKRDFAFENKKKNKNYKQINKNLSKTNRNNKGYILKDNNNFSNMIKSFDYSQSNEKLLDLSKSINQSINQKNDFENDQKKIIKNNIDNNFNNRYNDHSPKFAEKRYEYHLKPELKCINHDEELLIFCEDDQALCCTSCLLLDKLHINHRTIPIKNAYKQIIAENQLIYHHKLRTSHSLIENELNKAQINLNYLNSALSNVLKNIKNEFDGLYNKLKIKEESLIQDSQKYFNEKFKEVQTKISNFSFLKSFFSEKFDNFLDNYKENETFEYKNLENNIIFFRNYQEISNHLRLFSKDFAKNPISEEDIKVIEFSNHQKIKIIESIESFGKFSKPFNKGFSKLENNFVIASTIEKKSSLSPRSTLKFCDNSGILRNSSKIKSTKKQSISPKSSLKFLNSEHKHNKNQKFKLENKDLFYDSLILKRELRLPKIFMCILPEKFLISMKNKENIYTNLLYRLTRDGASSLTFHIKSDGKTPIVGLIQAGKCIFGFYSDIPFKQEDENVKFDGESWIFSLRNKMGFHPMKFPVKESHFRVIQKYESPVFGKNDLYINFDNPKKSMSLLGSCYELPSNIDGSTILAGSCSDWQIIEIEIYTLGLL